MKIKHSLGPNQKKKSRLSEEEAIERRLDKNIDKISKEAGRDKGQEKRKRKAKKVNFINEDGESSAHNSPQRVAQVPRLNLPPKADGSQTRSMPKEVQMSRAQINHGAGSENSSVENYKRYYDQNDYDNNDQSF